MNLKTGNNKFKLLFSLVGISIIWLILFSVFVDFKKKIIFPDQESPYIASAYNDVSENGNSIISLNFDSIVHFSYTIGDSIQYPYCGIFIEDSISTQYIDAKNYDFISVKIRATKGKKIPLIINVEEKGYSKVSDPLSFRPLFHTMQVNEYYEEQIIDLHSFETPTWWLKQHNITTNDYSLENIKCINFENCILLDSNIQDDVYIKEIYFIKDNKLEIIFIILTYLIAASLTVFFFLRKKEEQTIYVPVTEQKVVSHEQTKSEELDLIINYIAQEYPNPDLGLTHISNELSISENNISKYIKTHFKLSFKEYLNFIRLTEAKRLLKESDLNVSEIAYTVGYGNVSHFNRVFKKSEDISPNQYRNS